MENKDEAWIEETLEKKSELPEAATSVTWKGYYKGFSVLVTKRDAKSSVMPLLDSAMASIEWMIEKGFQPSWNTQTNTQTNGKIDSHACSQCGGDTEYKEGVGKTSGKPYKMYKCKVNDDHMEWVR